MRSLTYTVALYLSEEGYSVSCPGLPGCWSQGETEAEAIANIQVAIQEYLAAIAELVPSDQRREVDVLV
ncbi:MAG: type II toxin-antitoxin system HicB family antitoxin [Nodosilinea sp.]